MAPPDLTTWATELDLPLSVVESLCAIHGPLASWLASRQAAVGRPLITGVNGAQGTGKSTLLALVTRLLRRDHGLSAAGLSLDDLYLTKAARETLARTVHPLLATRGVPGTHDIALGHQTLDALTSGPSREVTLPAFDKATDDRAAPARWPRVHAPCDVVILEGWCVGARPEPPGALVAPVNELERRDDPRGDYRRWIDDQLRGPYAALFERLDALVLLKAPDMDCVRQWRTDQEHALRRRLAREGRPDTTMSDDAIAQFVQLFERLTQWMLREMPGRADVVLTLDRNHQVESVRYSDEAPA
jgi:D-glycerate 3-kinase